MNKVFSKASESNEYIALSTPSGLEDLHSAANNGQVEMGDLFGGKRRGRKAVKKTSKKGSKKMSGGKKASRKGSKKASKNVSKKGSKKMSGGKRKSRKASKKVSKKGSKKQSTGGKRRVAKKTSKKTSKKGSKKQSVGGKTPGPKRTMPPAAKAFTDLVKIVSEDNDVPVKYNVAMRVAKAYKDDLAKEHSNMSSGDVINKAKKEYSGESAATKKKYLAKAEKLIADSKADRQAKKANK